MRKKTENLVFNESQIINFRDKCKLGSKKIVLASGVFDILHEGHLKFLQEVSQLGDELIVGINDDHFARKKGPNRPIQSEYNRAFLISAFKCVSCVHIFDNRDPNKSLLNLVQPDVLIMSNSSEEKPKDRTHHHDLMKKIGGKILVYDAFSETHSTDIIRKIEALV